MKPTLSFERFSAFIEDRNDKKCREMYRELLHDLSTAEDALKTHLQTKKAHAAFKNEPTQEMFQVYAITSGGKLWKYNCGWWPMDKSGKVTGPPIGHVEFRKKPLAKKDDHWIRLSRPEGAWRRHIDCVLNHVLFGNGKVLCTDGVHALFQFTSSDGVVKQAEVMFQSLTEIAVTSTRRSSGKQVNKSPKEKKMSTMALDLL